MTTAPARYEMDLEERARLLLHGRPQRHAVAVLDSPDGWVAYCLHCGPIAETSTLSAAGDWAKTHSLYARKV